MFQLTSDITIGNFRFSGVHEVQVKRSIHSYTDVATITLPATAQVNKNGKVQSQGIVTGKQFTDGDPVTINLGYNGKIVNEFKGFVTSRDLNTPLKVACEGYSYQLKRNNVSGSWSSISVADLLQQAINGTSITKVICTVDVTLHNLYNVDATGAEIIDTIIKETDGNLSVFFIQPDVLWCGMIYTPYAAGTDIFNIGSAKYRLGYNIIKDNSLKQRLPQDDPGTHIYIKKTTNGQQLRGESTDIAGVAKKYKRSLNRITDAGTLKALAQEHQYLENYTGYEGRINAFLQPCCSPGFLAWVSNDDYKERDAFYLAESIELTFGTNGARRQIDIGAKLGFGNSSS